MHGLQMISPERLRQLRTDGRTGYEAPTQEPAPASNGFANIEAPALQPATPTTATEIDKENDNDKNEGNNDKEKKRINAPTPEGNTKSPNKDDNEESRPQRAET